MQINEAKEVVAALDNIGVKGMVAELRMQNANLSERCMALAAEVEKGNAIIAAKNVAIEDGAKEIAELTRRLSGRTRKR